MLGRLGPNASSVVAKEQSVDNAHSFIRVLPVLMPCTIGPRNSPKQFSIFHNSLHSSKKLVMHAKVCATTLGTASCSIFEVKGTKLSKYVSWNYGLRSVLNSPSRSRAA